jgi:4-amino-4-deoxy-L-arabinose transferase-like glycosyltransferase
MLGYAAIFICVFGVYLLISLHLGILNAHPEFDGPDYDSIAFNIAHHRGFGYDWDDPDWRQPYLNDPDPDYQEFLRRHSGYYPDVYRPPAMPYLLALVYGIFGRNFAAWRVLSCAIMAGAATIAAAISAEFAGGLAAVITVLLILQCPRLTGSSHVFMTEGLATFLLTLLAWTWFRNTKKGWTIGGTASLGIVLAALALTRYIFLLWVPLLPFCVPAIPTSSGLKNFWRGKAVCLSTALLIISPWAFRNIIITKELMPFGTQGQMELFAAFSPQALQARGR